MSSSLCSVARETVTPPTSTGSSTAHGLSAPVRPTRIMILFSRVTRRHRRPLERARPPRSLVQRAELALLRDRVDLDHDAVDLVVELRATALPRRGRPRRRRRSIRTARRRDSCGSRARAATAALPVRLELEPLAAARAVDPDRERHSTRDRTDSSAAAIRRRRSAGSAWASCPPRPAARSASGSPTAACRPRRAPPAASADRRRTSTAGSPRRSGGSASRPRPRPVAARRAANVDAVLVVRLIARPSIFGSMTYATGSSRSRRFLTSSANFDSASSVVTLSSDPIGTMCSTFWNWSDGGAPTRRLGESWGTSSSGSSCSSSTSSS